MTRLWPDSWTEDDIVYHTLLDCITSFDVDGDTAEQIVQYVLSDASGLAVEVTA